MTWEFALEQRLLGVLQPFGREYAVLVLQHILLVDFYGKSLVSAPDLEATDTHHLRLAFPCRPPL